jgi:hypothetical protein
MPRAKISSAMSRLSRWRTRYSQPVFLSFRLSGTTPRARAAICCRRKRRIAWCTTGIPASFVMSVGFADFGTPSISPVR